jgi:hypothetical protein
MSERDAKKGIKDAVRVLQPEVRRVLMEVWDPIGFRDEPQCWDEYDCCIGHVIRQLFDGSTDDDIAEYLFSQATEHMGCHYDKESGFPAVAALRKIALPTPLA